MVPFLHDNYLVSYEVQCEARTITLNTLRPGRSEGRSVTFLGVEGYQFEHDGLGNTIFALEEIPVEQLVSERGDEMKEALRVALAPPWEGSVAATVEKLLSKGARGFVLSSSYGLEGWILAKEIVVSSYDHSTEPV
jgi:hypothetical protein